MADVLVTNATAVPQHLVDRWIAPGESVALPEERARAFGDVPGLTFAWAATRGVPSVVDGRLAGLALATPLSAFDGYGLTGILTVRELLARGIGLDLYDAGWINRPELDPAILAHLAAPKVGYRLGVAKGDPSDVIRQVPARTVVAHTMWESDRLLPEWADALRPVPLVIVPSQAQIAILRDSGHAGPVAVVPDPIDVAVWSERPTKPAPDAPFTFVSWGRLSSRKMPVEMVLAFQDAFPIDRYPDVRFELKTNGGNFGAGPHQIPAFADPRIVVHDGAWTVAELRDWVGRAHAAFFLTRGEGMMNPPMQAMCLGVPTIVADHSGPADYADERWNWPVALDEREPKIPSPMGAGLRWWNPSHEDAVAQLRAVYDDSAEAARRAKAAQRVIRRRYHPATIADQLLRTLAEVDA